MAGTTRPGFGRGVAQTSGGAIPATGGNEGIGLLYEAAVGTIGWSAPLSYLCDVFDGDASLICWRDLERAGGGIIEAGGPDGDAVPVEPGPDDLDLSRLETSDDPFFVRGRSGAVDGRAPPYRAGAVRFQHGAIGVVRRQAGLLVFIEVLRRKGRPAFEPRHLAGHAPLLEHLRRAWLIRALLHRTGMSVALEDSLRADDVLGLDLAGRSFDRETGRDAVASPVAGARASAPSHHATSVHGRGGQLGPGNPSARDDHDPQAKIAFLQTRPPGPGACDAGGRATRMLQREASVTAIPLFGQAAPEVRLRLLYKLTPAESRIAVSLARGRSLQDAADRLEISVATVRTHLSRIYDKTGTCRQSELVALLLRGPARLGQA